jgi:enhancin-like peptidase M60 family/peptidase M60-like protein
MNQRMFVGWIIGILLLANTSLFSSDAQRNILIKNVSRIDAPGIPGPLCVVGEQAFVVVSARADKVAAPVVAAGRFGKGRVVALGHTGYLDTGALEKHDTKQLMLNALAWAGRKSDAKTIKIAVYQNPKLKTALQNLGLEAEEVSDADLSGKLRTYDVLCAQPSRLRSDKNLLFVQRYLNSGGGLIAADLGWGWLQLNRGKSIQDHHGNQLLAPAGILWADGYLAKDSQGGITVKNEITDLLHSAQALDAMIAQEDGSAKLEKNDLSQVVSILTRTIRTVPANDKRFLSRLKQIRSNSNVNLVPSKAKPLSQTRQPLARLLLTMDLEEIKKAPSEKIRAHPAAAQFPGLVPTSAKPVNKTIEIDTNISNWHSTGLYAPPGKLIYVDLPSNATKKGLYVRIGCHQDKLWGKDTWRRCPEICRRFALAQEVSRAANALGGPVYIEVPRNCNLGSIKLSIRGAVQAPLYVLGKTDLEEWRKTIRHHPGPWAELASSKVILSVPSENVRNLEDPRELMIFWDKVLDSCAELAARPIERTSPERYVTDIQISAGYMHSGYPIMAHLDMAKVVVDKQGIVTNSHGGVWGLFHEMGHNHQSGDWTFGGTGEVTVNLFTIYTLENACGLTSQAHGSFTQVARNKKVTKYLRNKPNFEDWKRDPFLALDMYIRLQEAFGWQAFMKVFAEYRDLPRSARPKNDDEKRDQWMVRFSRTVGKNLGPYFEAWGVPTSQGARDSIEDLPKWMPKGFPPK